MLYVQLTTNCLFLQYTGDSASTTKESANHNSASRDELQRKEREHLIERKRKETGEGKEKKSVREAVAAAVRANSSSQRGEFSKEKTILLTKDMSEAPSGTCTRNEQYRQKPCFFWTASDL